MWITSKHFDKLIRDSFTLGYLKREAEEQAKHAPPLSPQFVAVQRINATWQ